MNGNAFEKATSLAFTGHRVIPADRREEVRERLAAAVSHAFSHGICQAYCGMALGFDMMAAETVLSLKDRFPHVRLAAVVPFPGQCGRWSDKDRERYRQILDMADKVIVLSPYYYKGCYLRRNDYMLSHADCLIAYYDGSRKGGTRYTYKQAIERGMKIVNIFKNLT